MTALTRREALLLTAAVTTVSAAVQSTAAADDQPASKTDDFILEVPAGVADASAIPITVSIPAKDIDLQTGDSLTNVTIRLTLQKVKNDDTTNDPAKSHGVFTATLTDRALPNSKADIVVMTNLKIVYDPFKDPPPAPTQGTPPAPPTQFTVYLLAKIDITFAKAKAATFIAHQSVTLLPQDCAPSNLAVLRLGLQPPSVTAGKAVLVRAFLPATPIPYPLNKVTCTKPDDANPANRQSDKTPFEMDIVQQSVYVHQKDTYVKQTGVYIADEVFVSFNLFPNISGPITMTWDYQENGQTDTTKIMNLSATSYVAVTPSST